jgi:hypothetical protein
MIRSLVGIPAVILIFVGARFLGGAMMDDGHTSIDPVVTFGKVMSPHQGFVVAISCFVVGMGLLAVLALRGD